MKKFLYTALMLLIPTIFYGNISVNKGYIIFENSTKNESLSVINQGTEDKTYKVSFVFYKQNPDGSYTKVDKEDDTLMFADKYLDYTPKQFTLKPKASQIIRFQKKSMAEAKDGEYSAQLMIEEQAPKLSPTPQKTDDNSLQVEINPLFTVTLPVVLRKGELVATTTFNSAKIQKNKDELLLNVSLNRQGDKSTRGTLVLKANNNIVSTSENVNIFVTSNTRTVSMKLAGNKKDADKLLSAIKGQKVIVEYLDANSSQVLASKEIKI